MPNQSRKFRVIDPEIEHPKEIAKRRARAYKFPRQAKVNIHCPEGAPTLNVTEILEKADIRHMLGKI